MESIRDVLSRAKIEESDLKFEIQYLEFDDSVENDFRFVQVTESLLADIQSGEQEFVFRGDDSDAAVVCTNEKTFVLKESETSNTVLIVPECRFSKKCNDESIGNADEDGRILKVQVVGIQHKTIELLEEKRPRMEKLRQMLAENLYNGPQNEPAQADKPKYRLKDFLERIPASEKQILDTLSSMRVVEIDDYYRQLDFNYIVRIYTELTQCLDENGWSWQKIDKARIVESLENEFHEPPVITESFFRWFARQNPDEDGSWRLDAKEICRLCAVIVLRQTNKFNMQDFFDIWTQSVPYGMSDFAISEHLAGLALIRHDSRPKCVQYLPAETLPDDLEERLAALFQVKPKWTLDELKAYLPIDGVADMGSFLMKYCRVSTGSDGKKWYTHKKSTA